LRRSSRTYRPTRTGTASNSQSASGQTKDMRSPLPNRGNDLRLTLPHCESRTSAPGRGHRCAAIVAAAAPDRGPSTCPATRERLSPGEVLCGKVPVEKIADQRIDVIPTPILVVEVVRMLPDVDRQQRLLAL